MTELRLEALGSTPAERELMNELNQQLRALNVGTVQVTPQQGQSGTLPEPITALVVLACIAAGAKAVQELAKAVRAIIEIVSEVRERRAVKNSQSLAEIAKIRLVVTNGVEASIELPATDKRVDEFLHELASVGQDS